MQNEPAAGLVALRAELNAQASDVGISASTIDRSLSALAVDDRVLQLANTQPEHSRTTGDYLSSLVSLDRITQGRDLHRQHGALLLEIEQRFGVPAEILLAIWGIESNFGSLMGQHTIIRSFVTLIASGNRRRTFWMEQLLCALQIIERDQIPAEQLVGSWAGAMGHMQFMPSTYRDYAVDFDGDGICDIWQSIPDALASAANYLKQSGWSQSFGWGTETALPKSFDFATNADGNSRSLEQWQQIGIELDPLAGLPPVAAPVYKLLLPAGALGPKFLVSPNFDAILAYNAAVPYALAVGHLADRIAGGPPLAQQWPQDTPLGKDDRVEMQRRLVELGYNTGGVDGIMGRASRQAVRDYQIANGLLADGYPDRDLLEHLRKT